MLRKIYFVFSVLLVYGNMVFAQSGTLKGKVIDKEKNEAIPFANVVVESNGTQVGGTTTDFDGNYTIKPISPGKYTIKASYVGYTTIEMQGVIISADKITFQDIKMSTTSIQLGPIEVITIKGPELISKDNTSTGDTKTREDIDAAPSRNLLSIAATTAGVSQSGEGGELSIKGNRSDATDYYIDGIKVRNTSLPKMGVEQVSVLTGGIPAQYGDAIGGIVNITTRGPSKIFSGSVEGVTSELFDKYGHNLLGWSISGPVKSIYDSSLKITKPVLGYFFAGELQSDRDPSPYALPLWKIKEDKLQWLQENPLRPSPTGKGFVHNAEFITKNDMEQIKAKENATNRSMRLNGKLDFQPSSTINITFGGNFTYNGGSSYNYLASLYNPKTSQRTTSTNWRAFGRFTQKFETPQTSGTNQKTSALIQNVFYSIQADYSRSWAIRQDDKHQDRIFEYGYLGKFKTLRKKDYARQDKDVAKGLPYDGYYMTAERDTAIIFEPADYNPILAKYTTQAYQLNSNGFTNSDELKQALGLLNGSFPPMVYSIWENTGVISGSYAYSNSSQLRFTVSGSADIKNHAIMLGMEYEQSSSISYGIAPIGLWGIMRQLGNKAKNSQLDKNSYHVDSTQGTYPYISYDYLYTGNPEQPGFFENVRKELGKKNTEWIDIDSYTPDKFKLTMFTQDELMTNGLVSASGYDYYGNKLKKKPSFDDFFTKKDANGNYTREVGAFEPNYIAGYIQDKFAFNDLIFNVGLRVDRFDANQKVLKDKYVLFETKKKGEVSGSLNPLGNHPSHIGDDYVVYVNDMFTPTTIVGYRNKDVWYDANGTEIEDPNVLVKSTSTGKITPYLVDPNKKEIGPEAFKDYKPQTTLNPRLAFSFPISDVALFFAHYDVLTQRPSGGLQLSPVSYHLIQSGGGGSLLNNPDLKPERTTDYELGFKQKLSIASALTLSAFYRETRDLIDQMNVLYAYPIDYKTFNNLDFTTTKGLTVAYDLRRLENIRLRFSYTLQFADGTGSNANSSASVISGGKPNLKVLIPLDNDQRHNFVTAIDFRYGTGIGDDKYNGPVLFGKKIFAAAGANLECRLTSGTPYTKQKNIVPSIQRGISLRTTMDGSMNGSRLPWQFRIDAKFDKSFLVKLGNKDSKQKELEFNIYLQVQNLLNTLNVVGVYAATGSPDDDGYLADPVAQEDIDRQNNKESFIDLYQIRVNAPFNYSAPRRMKLGVTVNF